MSTNTDLAKLLGGIADILDLQGEKFKPEAYRRAARSVEGLPEDIRALSARGELESVPGVGDAISEKIREFLRDGQIPYYERLKQQLPAGLLELMRLPGLGPKTARKFWIELGVEGPAELAAAIAAGRLTGLAGFGPKKIEKIRQSLAASTGEGRRVPLAEAYALADHLVAVLRTAPVDQVVVAGSLRRRRESVGDLDILVTSREPEKVFDIFTALPERTETRLRGPTKETIIVRPGVQVDLRVVDPSSFGAALQYFTGSKDHNVQLRTLARDRGLKINEYGVYRGDDLIAGATEADVYAAFGLDYIPPEIREGQGEIDRAARHELPRLVDTADLRGDLHGHVDQRSDTEIRAVVAAARASGSRYLGLVVLPGATAAVRASLPPRGKEEPMVWIGEEWSVSAWSSGGAAGSLADYLVLRPDGPTPPAPGPGARGPPVLLVGHLETGTLGAASDVTKGGPWVDGCKSIGAAIDLTERGAADGIDATLARRLSEAGGTVHVGGAPMMRPIVLGLARRGWIGPDRVLNALPAETLAGRLRRAPGRR